MTKTIEIRWHGRGGQGTVTAAKVLADACLSGGRHVQAFPEYGPERAGAPLRAYNRISDGVIRMYCPVLHPHIVSIADATLIDAVNVTDGTEDDTIFIVNTSKDPKEVREKLNARDTQKVFTIDPERINAGRNFKDNRNRGYGYAPCKYQKELWKEICAENH
jgi:pyruvate ferredoxin oxidoreductase gamma subunit